MGRLESGLKKAGPEQTHAEWLRDIASDQDDRIRTSGIRKEEYWLITNNWGWCENEMLWWVIGPVLIDFDVLPPKCSWLTRDLPNLRAFQTCTPTLHGQEPSASKETIWHQQHFRLNMLFNASKLSTRVSQFIHLSFHFQTWGSRAKWTNNWIDTFYSFMRMYIIRR